MKATTLNRSQTGLIVIDMQEKVFSSVDHGPELLSGVMKLIQGCQALKLPILVTEQYPQGLGETIWPIKELLGDGYHPSVKTTFSCMDDPAFANHIASLPIQQWILAGIEAHICILQTAKGLLKAKKGVVVANDAISSRSIFDFSTAIAEMRDEGIRISSMETILFELLKDSRAQGFKEISQIVKNRSSCCA